MDAMQNNSSKEITTRDVTTCQQAIIEILNGPNIKYFSIVTFFAIATPLIVYGMKCGYKPSIDFGNFLGNPKIMFL
jgi:hypothetical protein